MTEPNTGVDTGGPAPATELTPTPSTTITEPPAGSPGGPPAEPTPGAGPAPPSGPVPPAGQPGEPPPGTGDGIPAEIEMPENFDPYAFLKSRTGAEPTIATAGQQLYQQRVAFGQQGSELATLRNTVASQNTTIQNLQREGTGRGEPEGDVYDAAVSQMESQYGARPDPEDNPDGARRWDINMQSAATSITMDRQSRFANADADGARIAEDFVAGLPAEQQVEFPYMVNSLLGENFQRSNLSHGLLNVLYQGLMYADAVTDAYRAGASARAAQIVDAQTGGPPIHVGPGGGPPPPTTEGWTHASLMQASRDGAVEPADFDRILEELVTTGKAPPRQAAEPR